MSSQKPKKSLSKSKNGGAAQQNESQQPSEKPTDSEQQTPETVTPEQEEVETVPETETDTTSGSTDDPNLSGGITSDSLEPGAPSINTQAEPVEDGEDDEEGQEDDENAPQTDAEAQAALDAQEADTKAAAASLNDSGHPKVAAPEGRILEEGDELVFDAEQVGNVVVILENVYRKHTPPHSKRPTFTLVYRKGHTIPVSQVKNK